jgi:hypothetical protein
MEREQIIEQLQQINVANNAVEIYILAQPEINANHNLSVEFYKARLEQNLPSSIIDLYYPVIEKKLIEKEYDVMEYDPAIIPDRTVVWEQNSDEVPFYTFFLNQLNTTENINRYNSDNLAYDDIWAYWIKIYGNGNTYYLIKKVTSSKVIRTGGKLALIFSHDIFSKLESDVLTMDGTFDALYCNQFLLFENKQNFEKALLYEEVKQGIAIETLDEIGQRGFIENFEMVRNFLKDDYHSINKLNKIKSKPYFSALTFGMCKKIIADYGVDVVIDEANQKFSISSKAQAKHFIKVLNDDYLKSEMTNYKYSANSKEDI